MSRSINFGFILLFAFFSNCLSDELSGKLVFAHVIFRHGDRTPVSPYPTDPWRDPKFWPTGFGQLTNIGKMQHFELGKWLRNRYHTLLNASYSRDDLFVQSTDVDRTLMSALSNLAGLYEPKGNDIWNNNILWQPIPVHTVPEKDDNMLAGKKSCPAYEYAVNQLKNSPEFQKLNKKYSYMYDYLTKYTGKIVDTIEGVEQIYNTFYIEQLYNKTLPEWTKKVFPGGDMKNIADLSFALPTYTRKLARLKIGLLVKDIFDRFKKKLQKNKVKQSVWVYSAHDTTIANVLNAFKLFEWHNPPYTACILIELRIDYNKRPLISIFYKNSSKTPEPLLIPECGIQCPLSQMYNLYKEILPDDWEKECKLPNLWIMAYDSYATEYSSSTLFILLGLFITIGVFMSVFYFISIYLRRRQYVNYRCYVQ
ncbi:prostatic acid phosphatase [Condylostylus longicornis]|uniref:prostatic acid phosphatase n=1 Tax=Condylostylus longicornis TaxID=2530218 RepID=UPI00244DA9E1|nr:prostatic acid phosphatase [Condylostylus longicornis]